MQEVELKFLEIDVDAIKDRLKKVGAKEVFSHEVVTAHFFSDRFIDDSTSEVLRIRKIGDQVMMCYKGPSDRSTGMKSRKEIEFAVSDFDQAVDFLSVSSQATPHFTKKHRTHFVLDQFMFEIDDVYVVPPYLEIETQSKEDMQKACDLLGLDIRDGKPFTVIECYPEVDWDGK